MRTLATHPVAEAYEPEPGVVAIEGAGATLGHGNVTPRAPEQFVPGLGIRERWTDIVLACA